MPNKIPVSRAVFEQLHDAIIEKFLQENNNVKPSQEHLYGFNNYIKTEPSIRKFMLDKHKEKYDVEYYKKDFPKKFGRKRLLEYHKKPKYDETGKQLVDVAYLNMYLLYLGIDSLEEFEATLGIDDVDNNNKIIKYKCYYSNTPHTVEVLDIIINTKNNKVVIPSTLTKTKYEGVIKHDITANIRMDLLSVNSKEKRILSIILYTGPSNFFDRKFSLGVFINVSHKGHPYSGIMVFREDTEIDNEELHKLEATIHKYLENSALSMEATSIISRSYEFDDVVEQKYPDWKVKQHILNSIKGEYYFYSISPIGNTLLKRIIKITNNKNVFFKGANLLEYKGELSFINHNNIVLYHNSKDGLSSYYHILKIKYERFTIKLIGTYSGVNHENKPIYGKSYLVKVKEGTFDNEEAEFIYNTSDEYNKLLTDNTDFEEHFFGKRRQFHEILNLLIANPTDVSRYEGYYSMYYFSSNETKNVIKQNPFYVNAKGNVRSILKYNVELTGKLVIEGRMLHILFIDKQTNKFWGLITCYSRGYAGSESMMGTLSMNNIDGTPMVRKIAIIKENNRQELSHPNQIKIGSQEYFQLNEKYNGLGEIFQGEINNYIATPKNSNFSKFKKTNNHEIHFFNSAILNATQKQYKEAIEAFDLAIRHGYNDMERINDEMENGVFQPIKSEIKEVLKLINQ